MSDCLINFSAGRIEDMYTETKAEVEQFTGSIAGAPIVRARKPAVAA